ncbi:AhpC/TSA family protein [Flavobacteriaceae bacterium D16]|nr:AhpC/TSA family protein [Flavobacteriaceae bacterium D16]
MKRIIFGLIVLLTISCNEKPQAEFSLSGMTNGIPDGTALYLDADNTAIDSTIIENNEFIFNTKLSQSPLQVILRTKDFSHYRYLWLERNAMTFDATNSDFRNAVVKGSLEEDLSQNLTIETKALPRNERLKRNVEFVRNNPNSLHSAYILSVYATTWGKEESKELFDKFSRKNKNSRYGIRISKYIELNKNPEIGDKYVDFEMTDINGKTRRLSEFNGKLVLLEFWASNCGPCRIENPNLVKTYYEFKDKGFEIFAVSEDIERENWIKAIEKDKLPWLQVSDLDKNNKAYLIYGISGIPDNFLIDQNGIIIERNLRGEKLNEKLKELLN